MPRTVRKHLASVHPLVTTHHGAMNVDVGEAEHVHGIVKFFKADRGWGAILSPDVPGDVWVHFSTIEGSGSRVFAAGDVVDFDVEKAEQDSFHYRATRASFVRHGPAPELRRVGDQVVVVEPGTPDTPLIPRHRDPRSSRDVR